MRDGGLRTPGEPARQTPTGGGQARVWVPKGPPLLLRHPVHMSVQPHRPQRCPMGRPLTPPLRPPPSPGTCVHVPTYGEAGVHAVSGEGMQTASPQLRSSAQSARSPAWGIWAFKVGFPGLPMSLPSPGLGQVGNPRCLWLQEDTGSRRAPSGRRRSWWKRDSGDSRTFSRMSHTEVGKAGTEGGGWTPPQGLQQGRKEGAGRMAACPVPCGWPLSPSSVPGLRGSWRPV